MKTSVVASPSILFGVEARIKRARALKELHVLRSMEHVVDSTSSPKIRSA